jgi:hypothetical protein
MLIKFFGIVDVIVGLILLFSFNISLPIQLMIVLGIVLIVKSFFGMPKDFGSWIDFSVGIVMIFSSITAGLWIVNIILGLLILQKGVFSFL